MDPLAIFFAVLLLSDLFSLRGIRRLWRHEQSEFDHAPSRYWPWGAAAWRAWRRQQPVLVVGAIPLFAGAVVLFQSDVSDRVGAVGLWVAIVSGAVSLGLAFLNALFNQPTFTAPPHLRSEPGLLRDLGG